MTLRLSVILLAVAATVGSSAWAQSSMTPFIAPPPTQLQSGATPYRSSPLQSGATTFGSSQLQSGVTFSQTNPIAENSPVAPGQFNLGGLSTIPGADSASNQTNATNATSATSGKGYSK